MQDVPAQSNHPATSAFRPLRSFTLISLISILATSLLLSTWLRRVSDENLLLGEERSNVALSQVLANSVWPRFAEYLSHASTLDAEQIRQHPKTRELDEFVSQQVSNLNVYKIKIYDLHGYTLFSSDFEQIGESKAGHPSFLQARAGKVISKLSFRDKIYAQKELITDRNVIASYIPVKPGNSGTIQGVFEVYKDVTPIVDNINKTNRLITTGIISTLTLLFLVLFFVVRRADGIIQSHNKAQYQLTDKMRNIAFYDSLTGLPNRVLFIDRLQHAMQIATRNQKLVVLMFIDLDRFKQINDTFGHDAGDQLLIQVSERFKKCVRTGDTVSRIAGDEFTVLLEELSTLDIATVIAQRIISALAEPFSLSGYDTFVTCSIGMSVYPFDDDDTDSLIKKADAAMYFSKTVGRNSCHYYTPDMLKHSSERAIIEKELNDAIINTQFILHFQPKVNLFDLKMHGMEALLRWQHPAHGLLSPDQFIPVLEETGMIIQVGEWVMRESCRLTKTWQQEGLRDLCVAVNVSALQIRQPGFLAMVKSALSDTGLEPHHLELELTESCLIEDLGEIQALLLNLKNLGVKLTIDDFGIGYSSLNYLTKMSVDTLKIDRSFVRELMNKKQNRSIATAIISFAHSLNIDVVAEGVESLQQLTFISAMRCTAAQGYLISKPLSCDEFYQLHKAGGDFGHLAYNQREIVSG